MGNKLIREDGDYTINDEYPLKKTQNEGVEFILKKFNVLINHQVGLGKTYLSLTAGQHVINYDDNFKVLIFCPKKANSAFKNDMEEMVKVEYSMYTAEEKIDKPKSKFIIFNHTTMHKYEEKIKELAGKYKLMTIIDEVHIMQTKKTRQAKVLRRLRPYFKFVVGLSATPILNKKEGLYWIIDFIRPGFFGKYYQFERKYLKYKLKDIPGTNKKTKEVYAYKNIKYLKKKLMQVIHIRKRKYNLQFRYRKVDMDEGIRDSYIKAAKGIIEDREEEKKFAPRLHDLQQVVDNAHENMDSVDISNKEKLLFKTVKEIINRNEGGLIYVEYKSTEYRIKRLLEEYKGDIGYSNLYRITGSIKQSERVYIENNLDRGDIVIINEAGTESINLGEVNNVIFYDIPFAVGVLIQSLGRVTRLYSEYDKQYVYMLEVKDSIDTYKRLLIQNNVRVIKRIFGDDSILPQETKFINQNLMKDIRKKLLWKFREWGNV